MTHVFVAVTLGEVILPGRSMGFWLLAGGCSALPDVDALGLRLGIPYEHPLGHRGLTHSLAFAFCLSALGAWAALRWFVPARTTWLHVWGFLFAVSASHGVLDAMTNGGLGVAFLAPFHHGRWFLPVRPIEVSPVGLRAFWSRRGLRGLISEMLWVWLPVTVLLLLAMWSR